VAQGYHPLNQNSNVNGVAKQEKREKAERGGPESLKTTVRPVDHQEMQLKESRCGPNERDALSKRAYTKEKKNRAAEPQPDKRL